MDRYGTTYETDAGGPLVRVRDRAGFAPLVIAWNRQGLERLEVPGAIVRGALLDDALLGVAQGIYHPATIDPPERLATTLSPIDWARPTEIPAIAAPALVPAGAAAPLMNAIAILAAKAGVASLRYAGPYPSAALWRTLVRSFTTSATEEDFTRDFLSRAARVARDPIAIDFVPAPHERLHFARGHVELRDGIERAVIDGIAYAREESSTRLVSDTGIHAEIWFGDTVWARVATFAADGTMIDGPHPIPAPTSDVVGKQLPPPLVAALAELVVESVPAPLMSAARQVLATSVIAWADLGARVAVSRDATFLVHAALWERVAPLGMGRLALALVEALVPVVTRAAALQLSRAV